MICICGTEMIPLCNFTLEDYGYEGNGIVTEYVCPHCESTFQHVDRFKEEK